MCYFIGTVSVIVGLSVDTSYDFVLDSLVRVHFAMHVRDHFVAHFEPHVGYCCYLSDVQLPLLLPPPPQHTLDDDDGDYDGRRLVPLRRRHQFDHSSSTEILQPIDRTNVSDRTMTTIQRSAYCHDIQSRASEDRHSNVVAVVVAAVPDDERLRTVTMAATAMCNRAAERTASVEVDVALFACNRPRTLRRLPSNCTGPNGVRRRSFDDRHAIACHTVMQNVCK